MFYNNFSKLCSIVPCRITLFTLKPTVQNHLKLLNNRKSHVRNRMYSLSHGPKYKAARQKTTTGEFLKLMKLARNEKFHLSGAMAFLLISSSVTMSIPYCIGRIIDMLNLPSEQLKQKLLTFCQILVVIFAIGALANFGRVYLINISSYRIVNRLRTKTYNSILDQEIAFFDKTKTGELINRISSDASIVGLSITNNISDGLRSLFSFIAGSSLMIYTCPHLALVGLLTVSPVAVLAVLYGRYLKKITQKVQTALAEATEIADERISNIRTVQAFAKQQKEKLIYEDHIKTMFHFASKESLARAVFFGMSGFSGNLIALTVLYSGGFMMSDGAITIGGLSSFLLYAAYVGISIGGLSTFYAELMRGLGASSRLFELIERRPHIQLNGGVILPQMQGDIEFRSVRFAYPSRTDAEILSNFDLQIPAGSVFAIVGPSGSGKSTVPMLLLGFYNCLSGSVTVDGKDVRELDLQWLRENIGIVSQEPVLFSCTLRENILYGSTKDVSDAVLESVMRKANAWDFVNKFPQGLGTLVGERGVMLSGGQRQRIAIARALLKDPKILILDEATSALDAESEKLVQSSLHSLMAGRTVLTIAHRLSTISQADQIAVLNNGRIVEKGGYLELLERKGLFYRLVQHQSITC